MKKSKTNPAPQNRDFVIRPEITFDPLTEVFVLACQVPPSEQSQFPAANLYIHLDADTVRKMAAKLDETSDLIH